MINWKKERMLGRESKINRDPQWQELYREYIRLKKTRKDLMHTLFYFQAIEIDNRKAITAINETINTEIRMKCIEKQLLYI